MNPKGPKVPLTGHPFIHSIIADIYIAPLLGSPKLGQPPWTLCAASEGASGRRHA